MRRLAPSGRGPLLHCLPRRRASVESPCRLASSDCTRAALLSRADYPHFETRQTRWNDADVFGHVNNAVYYVFFDDAVNQHLHACGIGMAQQRFVAESTCRFLRPLKYPEPVECGLRVMRLGNSSVAYTVGLFSPHEEEPAAQGTFVHVYVGSDGRPMSMSTDVRRALSWLLFHS